MDQWDAAKLADFIDERAAELEAISDLCQSTSDHFSGLIDSVHWDSIPQTQRALIAEWHRGITSAQKQLRKPQ